MSNPFKVGDFVRLKRGHTKMQVVIVESSTVQASYCCSSDIHREEATIDKHRCYTDFVMWDPKDPAAKVDHTPHLTNESKPTMSKLYQVINPVSKTPRFGTLLTNNSTGQMVLEMKGEGGKVEAFSAEDLEVVTPYTFQAKGWVNGDHTNHHYTCNKGDVKVGDVLVSKSGTIYTVSDIDTKCEKPKKAFEGSKIKSTPIGV